MTIRKIGILCIAFIVVPSMLLATDLLLEDINFPFDSRIAVDDLKQIPALAELLTSRPELFIEIGGHADAKGSRDYNKGLSYDRVKAVKDILLANGVSADRIEMVGYGEDAPKGANESKEGRFINRRVVFSIYRLKDGQREYYYKDNEMVRPLEREPVETVGSEISLADVVARLDRIEKALEQLLAPQKASVTETGGLEERLDRIEAALRQEKQEDETLQVAKIPSLEQHLKVVSSKRGSVTVGLGSDDDEFAASVEGRLFVPVHPMFALQGGLRANINDVVKEYQLDAGVVGKHNRIQMGVFGSLKLADLEDYDHVGKLSQLSVAASYLFERGSLGAFMTEGMDSEDVISRDSRYVFSDLYVTEHYLKVRDRYGISFDYGFQNGLTLDGTIGVVRAEDDEASGRLKVAYPVWKGMGVFVQGAYNTGYMEDDDNLCVFGGIEVCNWLRNRNTTEDLRPMQVPEIAYELKTRTHVVESGVNLQPQVFISASPTRGSHPLTVSFSGSASDSDGTIVSYEWDFGDGESASGASATHTFTSAGVFNVTLTVTDDGGASASASIQINTTNLLPQVSIVSSATQGEIPLLVSFTGNAGDSDGEIVSYEWDLGDGTTASGQSVSHTYVTVGSFPVSLTVTDNGGGTATATTLIQTYSSALP